MTRLDESPEALDAAWRVVADNYGLVNFAVEKYSRRYLKNLRQHHFGDDEFESALRAAAEEALLKAVQTYDPTKGSTLAHYFLSNTSFRLHDAVRGLLAQKGGKKRHLHSGEENTPLPGEVSIEGAVQAFVSHHRSEGGNDPDPGDVFGEPLLEEDETGAVEDRIITDELLEEVRHLIHWLPDEFEYACVDLVALQGHSFREAGELLGCADMTVAKHYKIALQKVREAMVDYEGRRAEWLEIA